MGVYHTLILERNYQSNPVFRPNVFESKNQNKVFACTQVFSEKTRPRKANHILQSLRHNHCKDLAGVKKKTLSIARLVSKPTGMSIPFIKSGFELLSRI
jgi:hypothetical protein